VDDAQHSVFAWARAGGEGARPVVAIANFTPVPRGHYRIGLPHGGHWREILNSDSSAYGGSNAGNAGGLVAHAVPSHGFAHSATVTLPPLSTLWLVHEGE
jgi:1,4-alpha-glucan branching enzyme